MGNRKPIILPSIISLNYLMPFIAGPFNTYVVNLYGWFYVYVCVRIHSFPYSNTRQYYRHWRLCHSRCHVTVMNTNMHHKSILSISGLFITSNINICSITPFFYSTANILAWHGQIMGKILSLSLPHTHTH